MVTPTKTPADYWASAEAFGEDACADEIEGSAGMNSLPYSEQVRRILVP